MAFFLYRDGYEIKRAKGDYQIASQLHDEGYELFSGLYLQIKRPQQRRGLGKSAWTKCESKTRLITRGSI